MWLLCPPLIWPYTTRERSRFVSRSNQYKTREKLKKFHWRINRHKTVRHTVNWIDCNETTLFLVKPTKLRRSQAKWAWALVKNAKLIFCTYDYSHCRECERIVQKTAANKALRGDLYMRRFVSSFSCAKFVITFFHIQIKGIKCGLTSPPPFFGGQQAPRDGALFLNNPNHILCSRSLSWK